MLTLFLPVDQQWPISCFDIDRPLIDQRLQTTHAVPCIKID